MARKADLRYYETRPGAGGVLRRYWSPQQTLRDAGWTLERLPDDEVEAWKRVRELNDKLDAWRQGKGPAGNDAVLPAIEPGAPAPSFKKPAPRASIGWLIDEWYKTARWVNQPGDKPKPFSNATRSYYRWAAELVRAWADNGELPVRAVTTGRVYTMYQAVLVVNHSKANAMVKVLRLLMKYAMRRDIIKINPAEDPGMISLEPRIRIWTATEQAAMLEHAEALGLHALADAIYLARDIGQREQDILALPRIKYFEGAFHRLRARKTGALADRINATPRLRLRLAETFGRADAVIARFAAADEAAGREARRPAPQIVVSEVTGAAYKPDSFRHDFARVRAACAGLATRTEKKKGFATTNEADLAATAHLVKCPSVAGMGHNGGPGLNEDGDAVQAIHFADLRDTCVTLMAAGGATIPHICSITGHTLKSAYKVLEHYLSLNADMAEDAIKYLVAAYEREEARRISNQEAEQ